MTPHKQAVEAAKNFIREFDTSWTPGVAATRASEIITTAYEPTLAKQRKALEASNKALSDFKSQRAAVQLGVPQDVTDALSLINEALEDK